MLFESVRSTEKIRPATRRWGPKLLKLHRWTGVALGLLLILQGLSGASLVFRDALEPLLHPELSVESAATRIPVERLLSEVRSRNPDYKVVRIEFPAEADRAARVKMAAREGEGNLFVAIDPYRGAIVRQGMLLAWPFEFLKDLHEHLLAGETGEMLIGIEGLALIFMATSGLVVWWPGKARLRSGFTVVRRQSAAIFWRTLHRATGATLAVILLLSASTGVLMVFKDQFRSALGFVGEIAEKPSAKVAERPGSQLVPVDAIVRDAQARNGVTPLRELRFFDEEGRGVGVYLDAPDSPRPLATKLLAYDRYSGEELGAYVAGRNPTGNEVVDWLFPLHSGAAGGTLQRLVMMLGGLSLALLGGSGIWLWTRKKLRSRAATSN